MEMQNGASAGIALEQVHDENDSSVITETDLTIGVSSADRETTKLALNATDKIALNTNAIEFNGDTFNATET